MLLGCSCVCSFGCNSAGTSDAGLPVLLQDGGVEVADSWDTRVDDVSGDSLPDDDGGPPDALSDAGDADPELGDDVDDEPDSSDVADAIDVPMEVADVADIVVADAPDVIEPPRVDLAFERVQIPALAARTNLAATTFAFADLDGDGDTDIVVGSQIDLSSCALINVSTPGAIAFERHSGWCESSGPHMRITRFVGYDFDGDGRDEVAGVAEAGVALVIGLDDGELNYEYIGGFETAQCMPVPYDIDWDGDADLLIYCVDEPNRQFQRVDSGWEEMFFAPTNPWRIRSNTLGLGRLDVNRDGLIDLIRANDTFSVYWARNTIAPPGGVLERCAPDSSCFFTEHRFASDVEAWGSYMGIGNVCLEGVGEVLYLSDAGQNRAVRFDAEWEASDYAGSGEFGQASTTDSFGMMTDSLRFSWGVVVDDFNADGLDDVFVTNGGIVRGAFQESQAPEQHEDALLLQAADGTFVDAAGEVGITRRGPADSIVDGSAYLARGALKVDLDLDGYLDIVEAAKQGETRVYSVVEDREPHRCTLTPRSSVVTGAGFGYEVFTELRGWRRWDVAGQYWVAAAPDSLVAPARHGTFRFPSGYEMPFDCGDSAGPIELSEPDWLTVSLGDEVSVRFSEVEPGIVEASVDSRSPVALSRGEDGGYFYLGAPPENSFVLRLDGRWVARNWLL